MDAFKIYNIKINYVLFKFGYRSNKSLVTHKVYEKMKHQHKGQILYRKIKGLNLNSRWKKTEAFHKF